MSSEDIAIVRDWVIIVLGGLGTLAVVAILFLAFNIYRKVSGILNSVRRTARTIEHIGRDVVQPAAASAGVVGTAWRLVSLVTGHGKGQKKGRD